MCCFFAEVMLLNIANHKSFVEELTSCTSLHDNIPGVLEVTSSCTSYSAERIIEQIKLSQEVSYEITSESDDEKFSVTYKDHQHHVNLPSCSCSCGFSKTMGLPCRHLFTVRTAKKLPVFDLQMVARRWLKEYQLLVGDTDECSDVMDVDCDCDSNTLSVSQVTVNSQITSTLSRNQKYRKMLEVGQKLAMVASEHGMLDFRKKYDAVQSLLHCWENNIEVDVLPTSESRKIVQCGSVSISPCMVYIYCCIVIRKLTIESWLYPGFLAGGCSEY